MVRVPQYLYPGTPLYSANWIVTKHRERLLNNCKSFFIDETSQTKVVMITRADVKQSY